MTDKPFGNMPLYKYLLLVTLALVGAGELSAQTDTTIVFEPHKDVGINTETLTQKVIPDTISKDGIIITGTDARFALKNYDQYRFYLYSNVSITSTIGLLKEITFTSSYAGGGKTDANGKDNSPDGFINKFSSGRYYLSSSNKKIGVWESKSDVSTLDITRINPRVYLTKIEVTVQKYSNSTTISSAGYATYCCENAADYSKAYGLRAFKAKYDKEAKKIVLTPVGAVPANTPVVLKGNEGLHAFPTAEGTTDDVADNELKVATEDMTCTGNMWILVKKSNGVGFSPAKAGSTLKKGKCYIEIDASSAASAKFVGLDETTGIRHITASEISLGDKAYNLAGQRVGTDYKGVVIVGGKKVVRR